MATEFGNLVRMHRSRLRITQRKLAGLTGIAEITIAKIETGEIKRSKGLTVKVLADTFCLTEIERAEFFQVARQKYIPPPMFKDTVAPEIARLQLLLENHRTKEQAQITRTINKLADRIEEILGNGNRSSIPPRPLHKLKGYTKPESPQTYQY